MTKHLVRLHTTAGQRLRSDSGQGALEYIGILAVVALVISLALAGFEGAREPILAGIKTLIDRVFTAA